MVAHKNAVIREENDYRILVLALLLESLDDLTDHSINKSCIGGKAAACLGELPVPVGAELLRSLADGDGDEPERRTKRQRVEAPAPDRDEDGEDGYTDTGAEDDGEYDDGDAYDEDDSYDEGDSYDEDEDDAADEDASYDEDASSDEDDAREGCDGGQYTHADWQYSAEEWALVCNIKQCGNETDEHFEQFRRRCLRERMEDKEREERFLA